MMVVPFNARIQAFSNLKIFINKNNRCCKSLIIKKRFVANELVTTFNNFPIYSNLCNVEITEVHYFLQALSSLSTKKIHNKIGEFSLTEYRLKVFTGLNYKEIEAITAMLTSLSKLINQNLLQAVVIFLIKLRSGCSDEFINEIFKVKDNQCISNCCKSIITAFEKDVWQVWSKFSY